MESSLIDTIPAPAIPIFLNGTQVGAVMLSSGLAHSLLFEAENEVSLIAKSQRNQISALPENLFVIEERFPGYGKDGCTVVVHREGTSEELGALSVNEGVLDDLTQNQGRVSLRIWEDENQRYFIGPCPDPTPAAALDQSRHLNPPNLKIAFAEPPKPIPTPLMPIEIVADLWWKLRNPAGRSLREDNLFENLTQRLLLESQIVGVLATETA